MLPKIKSKTISKFKYVSFALMIVGIFVYTSCQLLGASSKTKSVADNTTESACINQNSTYDNKLDNFVKIKVGKDTEVIVDVVNIETEKTVRTAHIKRMQEYYIRHIPEGKYRLHVVYGDEYTEETSNGTCKGFFKKENSTEVEEDILDTYVVKTSNGINVPSYSLKLNLPKVKTSDQPSK